MHMHAVNPSLRMKSSQGGQIQRQAFKIVYVAPMKALAAEQTATFGRRLADLGEGHSCFDFI